MTSRIRKPTVSPQLSKTIAGHRLTRSAADIECGVWEVSGPTVVLAAGIVTIRPLKLRKGGPCGGWIIKRGFDSREAAAQTVAKVLAEGVRLGWLRPAGYTARNDDEQTINTNSRNREAVNMEKTFTKQVAGGVISGSSQAAVDALAAELERRAATEAEREMLFPGDESQRMTALANLFPTLRGVVPEPWDTNRFLAWFVTSGGSGGACHAARFLLNVWNPSTDWRDVLVRDEQREIEDDDTESQKLLVRRLKKLRSELRKDLEKAEAEKAKERKRSPYPIDEETVTEELHKCFAIVGPFNVAAAVGTWDDEHREAFMKWIRYPFWP